eukprot:11227911-Lingulodinium_polyedra.AAC.1
MVLRRLAQEQLDQVGGRHHLVLQAAPLRLIGCAHLEGRRLRHHGRLPGEAGRGLVLPLDLRTLDGLLPSLRDRGDVPT